MPASQGQTRARTIRRARRQLIDTTPIVTAPQAIAAAVAQPLALAAATAEGGTPRPMRSRHCRPPAALRRLPRRRPAAQGDKPADTAAKNAASAEAKAGVPRSTPARTDQARGNGGKSAGEFSRAAADLLAKPDANVPAQPAADAATATRPAPTQCKISASSRRPIRPTRKRRRQPPRRYRRHRPAAVPLSGLAVEIATQAHAGNKHFEIRLDPPELGRIDVKLDVDRDGNVSSRLVVDRADTLDLLKRDASTLERALQQSGLKTSDNALEFSLRQQGFAQRRHRRADRRASGGARTTIRRRSRRCGRATAGCSVSAAASTSECKDASWRPASFPPTTSQVVSAPATSSTGIDGQHHRHRQGHLAGNFQTFLTLLTTQLKNQNPLDPLDTNQFTAQLVQFAQVEQQLKSNDQLATLVSLQKTAQNTAALEFVGQTVGVDGATAPLSNGTATWNLSVPKPATGTDHDHERDRPDRLYRQLLR